MAEVRCVDGSTLGVHPDPVVDRDGVPYEITLRLTRDGAAFGSVGERCGWFLAATRSRLAGAAPTGDSTGGSTGGVRDDSFPASSVEAGIRAWAVDDGADAEAVWTSVQRYLPRDRDLFAFRARDPDDVGGQGELRCSLHTQREWVGGEGVAGGGGRWRVGCRAVLDAWGDSGLGLRAVLTAPQLASFLDALLADAAALGCVYGAEADVVVRRPAG